MYNLLKTAKWKQTGVFANNYDCTMSLRKRTSLFVTHGPRLFPQLMGQKGQDLGGFSPSALISIVAIHYFLWQSTPWQWFSLILGLVWKSVLSDCRKIVALNYHCTRLDHTCTRSHRMYYEAITRQQAGMKIIYTPIWQGLQTVCFLPDRLML